MEQLRVLITRDQIAARVTELGREINRDSAGEPVVFVGVLKGAAISLGLHAPLFASFIRSQPSLLTIVGSLLFILGGAIVALTVFRRPSTGEAGTEPRPTTVERHSS